MREWSLDALVRRNAIIREEILTTYGRVMIINLCMFLRFPPFLINTYSNKENATFKHTDRVAMCFAVVIFETGRRC